MIVQSVWQLSFDFFRKPVVVQPSDAQLSSDAGLASQPTLSRFENAIDVKSLRRLQDVLIDQFIESFDAPPARITLDIDPFDDPTHGQQQLTFFHGYYRQYQYLPRVITCAENDQVAMACLLHGSAHPALGADDDLRYLVGRLREAFGDVRIVLRADSGFGAPAMYRVCEELEIDYTIGIGMNATLKIRSDSLLSHCVQEFERTGEPQRKFCAFWYQAGSWPAQRWVVVKCEAHAQGTNRRAIVTNRPGAFVPPGPASGYAGLRRLRRPRREREPQQGIEVRIAGRSAQRSSLHGQLVPALLARRRAQLAGSHAPCDRRPAAGVGP